MLYLYDITTNKNFLSYAYHLIVEISHNYERNTVNSTFFAGKVDEVMTRCCSQHCEDHNIGMCADNVPRWHD